MEKIIFLNENSGAIMAILTLIYTIATITLVYMSQRTINEMKYMRKQQMLPRIVIEFGVIRKGLCCLILKNCGESIASRVSVKFSDECKKNLCNLQISNGEMVNRLSSGQMVLAPKQFEYYCLCGMVGNFEQLGCTPIEGYVTHSNIYNETVTEAFSINVLAYEGALLYGVDVDEITSSIDSGMKKLVDAIKGYNK